jgi:hypothetical protein
VQKGYENMKLTIKQLKQIIREEYRLVRESEWGHNYDDPDEILNIIGDVENENDLVYYHKEDGIKKMIATLRAGIVNKQAEFNKLDKEYNDAQRTREGEITHPPDWWDGNVFPIQREIDEYESAIKTLQKATFGLMDMGLDPEPLTDDEIEYQFDDVIDYLNQYVAWTQDWVGSESAFRETLLKEIKEYSEEGNGHPPEEKWYSIIQHVMDEYFKDE